MSSFAILHRFLDRCGSAEVEGRSLELPPALVSQQLRDFAAGTLPAAERDRIVELLKEHPQWIALVAEETRLLRSADHEPLAPACEREDARRAGEGENGTGHYSSSPPPSTPRGRGDSPEESS